MQEIETLRDSIRNYDSDWDSVYSLLDDLTRIENKFIKIPAMGELWCYSENLMDSQVIDALKDAYSRSTPIKILEALNNIT